jgi:hypothetical protein
MLNNWPNPPIERFFSLFLGWGVGGVGGWVWFMLHVET